MRSTLSRCVLAALLTLAACSGDSTSPADSGRISFSYSGAESGRFVAKGSAKTGNDPDFAYASLFQRSVHLPTFLVINGSMRLGDGTIVKLRIVARPVVIRSVCAPGFFPCEASANLVLNARSDLPNENRDYHSRSIDLNVSEVTAQRARGTFEMVVQQLTDSGTFTGPTIEVHSGEFDVPIVDVPPGS